MGFIYGYPVDVKITTDLQEKYTEFQLDKLRNHTTIFQECPRCGKTFDAQSYTFRPTAIYPRINKFCSNDCKKRGAGKANKKIFREYICQHCREGFTPHKNKPHQKFCDHHCYSLSRKVPRPEVQQWIHKITPPTGSVSKAETAWLSQFPITHTQHIITANKKNYRVDGFDEKTNTVYEYLGSFWHGNPNIYNTSNIHPVCKKTFGELYNRTMNRLQDIKKEGYRVVVEWSPR